jgi:hypothetical protein
MTHDVADCEFQSPLMIGLYVPHCCAIFQGRQPLRSVVVAAYGPARRLLRIQPTEAVRAE